MRCPAALALVAACGGSSGDAPDAAPDVTRAGVVTWTDARALDVLFVVDDSAGMDAHQAALAAAFPAFAEEVAGLDLHVGVVSSDIGAGPLLEASCSPGGDDGLLQACAGDDPFLTAADAAAFACNVALGVDGCGFEQHLAAMARALDGSNVGFRRPGAHLQVIVLADEDDCSAHDQGVFTVQENEILGPFSSFRCFEHGVRCEADDDPRAPGPRAGCAPDEASPYLDGVAAYAALLREAAEGTQVLVSVIAGDATPVEVGANPETGDPALVESCRHPSRGRADPAVRLAAFAAAFPPRGALHSICDDDLAPAMRAIGAHAAEAITTTCVAGDVAEAACAARDVTGLDTPSEASADLPRCADDATPPCFRFVADDGCASGVALEVDRAAAPSDGVVTVVECRDPA